MRTRAISSAPAAAFRRGHAAVDHSRIRNIAILVSAMAREDILSGRLPSGPDRCRFPDRRLFPHRCLARPRWSSIAPVGARFLASRSGWSFVRLRLHAAAEAARDLQG